MLLMAPVLGLKSSGARYYQRLEHLYSRHESPLTLYERLQRETRGSRSQKRPVVRLNQLCPLASCLLGAGPS